MKKHSFGLSLGLLLGLGGYALPGMAGADEAVKPSPNGIEMPKDYKDWKVISLSHRTDFPSLRVILGNDIAVAAAREGKTNPWPDGAILGKVVWRDSTNEKWEAATEPGDFAAAEFMVKDATKYTDTGGWGYARWIGLDQKPYGEDASFAQQCVACHAPVADRDYVFTTPAVMP
jgi:hypothetical protein